MLQLNYPEYEVIVINEGSWDGTLVELRRVFALVAFAAAYRERIEVRRRRNLLCWLAGAKGQWCEMRRTASSRRSIPDKREHHA